MDKNGRQFLFLCILTAALILILATVYYGAVIKPGLDERDMEIPKIEVKAETWTPELREAYNDSQPIEFLEYHHPNALTINDQRKNINQFTVVTIPDSMENRASFAIHTDVYSWENNAILVGNKTMVKKTEREMAYVFANVTVSNSLHDKYNVFPSYGLEITEINLISAPFQENATYEEVEFHDAGGVLNVTFQENATYEEVEFHDAGGVLSQSDMMTTEGVPTYKSVFESRTITSHQILLMFHYTRLPLKTQVNWW